MDQDDLAALIDGEVANDAVGLAAGLAARMLHVSPPSRREWRFDTLFVASLQVGRHPVAIPAEIALLMDQHDHESVPVPGALQALEQLLLRLGHRTAGAMTLAAKLAHIDARRRQSVGLLRHRFPNFGPSFRRAPVWVHRPGADRCPFETVQPFDDGTRNASRRVLKQVAASRQGSTLTRASVLTFPTASLNHSDIRRATLPQGARSITGTRR
jgi:hypothetical protein